MEASADLIQSILVCRALSPDGEVTINAFEDLLRLLHKDVDDLTVARIVVC